MNPFDTPAQNVPEPTPQEMATAARNVDALRSALGFLLYRTEGGQPRCERNTSGIDACFAPGTDRTADARYGIDRACASCIAHRALAGRPIPTGPGRHADEDETTPSATLLVGISNPLPESMQPGWDPTRPGREVWSRFLEACIEQGVVPAEIEQRPDHEGH